MWFIAGQGADDGPLPFLSLHLSGAVFQSTFSWPVFAELLERPAAAAALAELAALYGDL
ncbi:hypothetical protein V6X57_24610 [Serratia bockelmannii]|uniref:hypothetical protein n=1 Tax=Serratia bockelmannii TaxID=2703793 RepID=UPI002FE65D4A